MSSVQNNTATSTQDAEYKDELTLLQQQFEATTAQLYRLNEEVEMISRAASHDLATPLRDIHLLCDFISESLDANDTADAKQNLARIGNRATRLENMLNSVLRYIHASQRSHTKSNFDLEQTLNKQFEKANHAANFSLRLNTECREVTTTHAAFCIVIAQLIDNAIKHHDKKEGQIAISTRHTAENMLEVSVEDDGPGIEKAYQKRIFTAFETLKPKDQIEGSGMGLTIAKRLLVSTNGSISVNSPVANNRGTCIKVCFPC